MGALIFIAVICLLSGLCIWLLMRLRQLRAHYTELSQRLEAQNQNLGISAPELKPLVGQRDATLITIELLNPLQLAAKQSWYAEQFGSVTPSLIRQKVYEQIRSNCLSSMAQQGVDAEVKIVHLK